MEFKTEDVSPVERKITITVPVEEANAAISATVAMYKTTVDFKGFRKGKAPSQMVEGKFKSQIYEEATTDLINYQLNEVLGELKIQPLSRLDVDAGLLERDKEFVYTVGFETAPEFTLPDYRGLDVEQEKPEIAADEVEAVIERIRDNLAEAVTVTDSRTPKDGDIVIVDFSAWQDGKAIDEIKASNFQMVLGENQALPEFEEIVKKLKADERGEDEVTFPEDFINKDFAGQTVTLRVKLIEIKEKVMPEVDDAFAAKAGGFKDVAQLREAIENSYLESRRGLVRGAAQKKLIDQLLEQVDFMLPPMLVEEHMDRLLAEFKHQIESQGRHIDSLGKTIEELREDHRPRAEDMVRAQLLMLAIANKENLEVKPEEVDQFLYQEALRTKQDPEALRRYHEENNLLFALKDKLLSDKAIDIVYGAANVKEVAAVTETKKKAPAKKAAAKKPAAKKTAAKKPAAKKTADKKTPAKKAAAKKPAAKKTAAKKPAAKKAPAKKAADKK